MARILVIGKYYPPFEGGTEVYTRDVCNMLAQDHEVTAVVYNHIPGYQDETIDRVRVVRCSTQVTWNGQPIALSMFKAIDLADVDLVHFHAPNFFANAILLFALWRCNRNIPVIVTHHMEVTSRPIIRPLVMPLYRQLIGRSVAVIVTSAKNVALSKNLPKNAPTIVIPLGIDVDRFCLSAADRLAALKWKEELVGDKQTIGFIGRHARYKGLDVLIKAIANIKGVHALIAGDGPFHQSAIELAAEIGICDRVHFLGRLSDSEKKVFFAASDVFAFPSTEVTEAFGFAQLEAMAMGVPVVSSDLPTGVTDVAIDRITAFLAPPGDAEALADCITRVLKSRALANELAERARQHVYLHFTRDLMLERTRSLMELHLRGHVASSEVPDRRPHWSVGAIND